MITNFILFIILFGVLVFIHELGHYLTARKMGVGVEKFFLGFGPKIFSVKRGDTEYGIAWIPLGGYVKLVGEDPNDEKAKAPNEKSFMSKPPLKRIAIVAGGPISNLILPILLFGFLYFVGIPSLGPNIGEVIEDSPAAKAGLLQGDKIIKVKGNDVKKWEDLTQIIRESDGSPINLSVERKGEIFSFSVAPKKSIVENIFREKVEGWTIGITPYQYEPTVGIVDQRSPAYKGGLRTGDVIKEVNGVKIDYYWEFENLLKENKKNVFSLVVERGKDATKQKLSLNIKWNPKTYSSPLDIGIYRSELFISSVAEGSIAKEKGIKAGDMITSINGVKAYSWLDLRKKISDNNGEEVNIELIRGNKKIALALVPKLTDVSDEITGANEKKRELGIEPVTVLKDPPAFEVVEKTLNPIKAVYLGSIKTYEMLKNQTVGFYKLIIGKLSVKNIGGPILMYKLAGRSYAIGGIFSFINYIALLSIVLGFVNLLPIPILDGGYIAFCFVEMIRRKPLSMKAMELASKFGMAFIFGLLILASYNDVNRYFWESISQFLRKIF